MLPNFQCQTHILLTMVFFSFLARVAVADDELTLSIETKQLIDGVAAIDIDKPFHVVFTNKSNTEVRIWHPHSRDGYYCLTFESRNLKSGARFTTKKRRIDDDGYFKAVGDERAPGSNVVTIQPRDSFTMQVELIDYAWGKLKWLGVPEPNTGDQYLIHARYRSKLKNKQGSQVWTGSISSAPTKLRIVSERIDTPHEYLWNNFPKLALHAMKDNPAWVNRRDEDQRTPLHVAARFKHVEVVNWLLENGADVNAIAYNGFTPLHLTSDPEVVKAILKHEPNLEIACRIQGQTPLQDAANNLLQARTVEEKKRWRSIADLYLAAGAEYDILTAIAFNDLDRVKATAAKVPKPKDGFYFNSPLRRAASLGRLAICRYLVEEHHADVNQFDQGAGYPI
ncbi:MAG: ankyrin repeat domain-containing protein, partial [Planctomycetaceae bacterium]|nr:ankyrin repeat domain-containing protein [Planctomycetaceae bacterium]